MQEDAYERARKRRHGRTGLFLSLTAVACIAACIGLAALWESYKRRTQMQNDPNVARVWIAGITFGPRHVLTRGSNLQKWLNERHITLLGDYERIQSQYANDPGAMAIWFNYESYLIGQPDLECHRIQPSGTAFVDDLGQVYHGFLDIHGKTVAVYLPGYDHSAHEMRCIVKWMPRKPAAPSPVSRPMIFKVALPRTPRILPLAETLPRIVTAKKNGITVTVDAARLGPVQQTKDEVWHDLTFRLKVDGGEIANDNATSDLEIALASRTGPNGVRAALSSRGMQFQRRLFINRPTPAQRLMAYSNNTFYSPMTLTDPYGFPLLATGLPIAPLVSAEAVKKAKTGDGLIWVARVSAAGKGTDAVRLHLDVSPKTRTDSHGTAISGSPVPFDLVIPVQTGDEI